MATAAGDAVGSIKLSQTLQFLKVRLNRFAGGDLSFSLDIDDEEVKSGEVIRARATVGAPEGVERKLTCIRLSLRGQIQDDGRWKEYDERAETAKNVPLPAGHEYVVPIVIKIPHNAVLSEDGAQWCLRAQAVVDRTIDPRDEAPVTVIGAGR